MSGERTLPGLGLVAFRNVGDDGWESEFNENARKCSALVQGRAISRVTALPGSPSNGDIYIVPSGAGANPNQIAVRDNGAWVYYAPGQGWLIFVADENQYRYWSGSSWLPFAGSLPTAAQVVFTGWTGIANAEDALLDLDDRLSTAEATLVSHGSRLTAAESDIDALEAEAADHETRLASVEAEAFEYRIGAAILGSTLGASERFFMHVFDGAVNFASGLTDIRQMIETQSTSAYDITVKKRTAAGSTSTVGTLSTNASSAFTGGFSGATSFANGDALILEGQATPDATLKNVSLTFVGTRP